MGDNGRQWEITRGVTAVTGGVAGATENNRGLETKVWEEAPMGYGGFRETDTDANHQPTSRGDGEVIVWKQ